MARSGDSSVAPSYSLTKSYAAPFAPVMHSSEKRWKVTTMMSSVGRSTFHSSDNAVDHEEFDEDMPPLEPRPIDDTNFSGRVGYWKNIIIVLIRSSVKKQSSGFF